MALSVEGIARLLGLFDIVWIKRAKYHYRDRDASGNIDQIGLFG
jgi:hypothetical protein